MMRKTLVCIAACFLFVLASCGSGQTSATPALPGTVTPDSSAPPGNFLYSSSTEAIFLAWVNSNGNLSGQTQDAKVRITSGVEQVSSTHGSFTGTLTNGQVNLNFGEFLGFSSNITGTYDGTTLILNFPTTGGGVGSFTFVPATTGDFNTVVSTLQTTAANNNATVTTEEAQATANVNATYTTQSEQQAVANANQTVANDISSLQTAIADLNQSANFDSVFSDYASSWKQMQNDYQTEVNDSKNGCANGNNGTVQGDAGTVQGDEGTIQGDDGTFDGQVSTIDAPYSSVQQTIANLKSDWQTLQQAVANNPIGTPSSNYRQSDIDTAITSGTSAQSNASSVVKKAKQERATYDDEASNLNSQAQALPGKMGC